MNIETRTLVDLAVLVAVLVVAAVWLERSTALLIYIGAACILLLDIAYQLRLSRKQRGEHYELTRRALDQSRSRPVV